MRSTAHATSGSALGKVGARDETLRLLKRLEQQPPDRWLDPSIMAPAYAAVGDMGRAIEWTERGIAERAPNMLYLKASPTWDLLRGDPRFQAIYRQVNFP